MTSEIRTTARRLAFNHYLRTGEESNLDGLEARLEAEERKFNPNHDPANGRFTFGPGGTLPRLPGSDLHNKAFYYQGQTKAGLGAIRPVSGGNLNADGRYVPEIFPSDPYAIHDATDAVVNYMSGQGRPMNYYIENIDTTQLRPESVNEINSLLHVGKPGVYSVNGARVGTDAEKHLSPSSFTEGAVIGGSSLRVSGVLRIEESGHYDFEGWVGATGDVFQFHDRPGRSRLGDAGNAIGALMPGRKFPIYIVGTKPFRGSGFVRGGQ